MGIFAVTQSNTKSTLPLIEDGFEPVMVQGSRGSGKSQSCQNIAYTFATRDDGPSVAMFALDHKLVEFSPWFRRFTLIATEPMMSMMLLDLLYLEAQRRFKMMAASSMEGVWEEDISKVDVKWNPKLGPYILLFCDEMNVFGKETPKSIDCGLPWLRGWDDDKEEEIWPKAESGVSKLAKLVRYSRAAGVGFVGADQYALKKEYEGTGLLENITARICHQLTDPSEYSLVLRHPADAISTWSPLNRPGHAYVKGFEDIEVGDRCFIRMVSPDDLFAAQIGSDHLRVAPEELWVPGEGHQEFFVSWYRRLGIPQGWIDRVS